MTTAEAAVAVETTDGEAEKDRRRKLTLLKAVGLDRVSEEQRELALAIAKRYDLDLLLKHIVIIDGRPFITRDALLWIAHRDGHLDGIEVTRPVIEGDYWYCEATVYRTDMSHPFKYGGRYPVKGGNVKFAPEMATKVAESMALRRAFNISAPTQDERWDVDIPSAEPEAPKTLAEKVAEKAAAVETPATADSVLGVYKEPETPIEQDATAIVAEVFDGELVPEPATAPETAPDALPSQMVQCESKSPFGTDDAPVQCRKEMGHKGAHKTESESWDA